MTPISNVLRKPEDPEQSFEVLFFLKYVHDFIWLYLYLLLVWDAWVAVFLFCFIFIGSPSPPQFPNLTSLTLSQKLSSLKLRSLVGIWANKTLRELLSNWCHCSTWQLRIPKLKDCSWSFVGPRLKTNEISHWIEFTQFFRNTVCRANSWSLIPLIF